MRRFRSGLFGRGESWTAVAVPAAAALILLALVGSELRAIVVIAVPLLVVAVTFHRWPAGARAAGATLLGVLALGAGVIAQSILVALAGVVALAAGLTTAWGLNRERPRGRAWRNRAITAVGTIVVLLLVVYPTLLAVGYLAKPRDPVREAALGLPHERVSFRASDGVRISGWWVPGRKRMAVVVVHGGGGDREGAVAHARMLSRAGYGVLLYDSRGRGRSDGHQNAFGWEWDRDVHGAVDLLKRRGVREVALLGLSTGAEAAVTEAARDPRVKAVVADGVQARTASDAASLSGAERALTQSVLWVAGLEIAVVSGEEQPPSLPGLVRSTSSARPLLMIATAPIERDLQSAYARGTRARVWELPDTAHTQGLHDHPAQYSRRVTETLERGFGAP